MAPYPESLQKMIDALCRFPGIGQKTAQRLAFFLLKRPRSEVIAIARALVEAKDRLRYCTECGGLTEQDPCIICTDQRRDRSILCVVQEPRDVLIMERTGQYKGLYHVLHGALSPLDGIGPENLRLKELVQRVSNGQFNELIVATNPNVEGDATAAYIAQLTRSLPVTVTRIAFGLPVGGDLEYTDELTLSRAIEGRIKI